MAKKSVTYFLLPAFCVFSMSCLSTVTKDVTTIDRANSSQQVISVVTKDGRVINFRKNDPGRVTPGSGNIIGRALQHFDVDRGEVQSTVKNDKGAVITVLMVGGSTYDIVSFAEEGGRIRFSAYAPITVPFSDIQQIAINKVSTGKTLLGAAGVVTVVVVVGGLVSILALISLIHHIGS